MEYETLLAFELANGESDEIVLLNAEGELELDGLMREVFLLEMDTKNLCSEDCKGLCPGCGADLNVEACRCRKEIDPAGPSCPSCWSQREDQISRLYVRGH